ncbi:MAG: shikimate dehydrogenase [Anaerolineae bacterium]|nr:shikimate dehydrogenase [Anaerolineae bacterium]
MSETQQVGLIGWPVAHSISPHMFTAAFASLGMDWRYTAHAIAPDDLQGGVERLLAQGLRGFNVTVPHKQAVLPLLTVIRPEAAAVGAVNTVIARADGTLEGTNTDVIGFSDDLLHHIGPPQAGARALILGAGGAARAAAFALARQGYTVLVASRRQEQAGTLIRDVGAGLPDDTANLQHLPWDDLPAASQDLRLIVNCTPVGMWPHAGATPWPEAVPLPRGVTVYDMIYRPAETVLLRQARAAGGQAISGLGMLVRQGAAAFTLWTGQAAPFDMMLQAAQEALHQKDLL